MDVPRAQYLTTDDRFDISVPFTVGDRVKSLAYQMAIAPPHSDQPPKRPSVSSSRSTTETVENELTCTARPLQGPPPEFILELLEVAIDLTPSSPLTLAIKEYDSSRLYALRGDLTKPTMPHLSTQDMDEDDYLPIVVGSLTNLLPVTALLLLQLWMCNGADQTDPVAFQEALGILLYLGQSTAARDQHCKPDHVALGPKPEKPDRLTITYGGHYAIAMIDRKSRGFAEYIHTDRGPPLDTALDSKTKDLVIQQVIQDGRPLYKFWKELTSTNTKRGWRVDTLHLLAQVSFLRT